MKAGFFIITHMPYADVMFHYNWHKKIAPTKILWRTDSKEKTCDDIIKIDVHKNNVSSYGHCLIYRHAMRYNFDYVFAFSYDCYILRKEFVDLTIKQMQRVGAVCSLGDITSRVEHWKNNFFGEAAKAYKMPLVKVKWTSGNMNVFTKRAIKYGNETSDCKVHTEVDVYCNMYKLGLVIQNEYTLVPYTDKKIYCYSAGNKTETLKRCLDAGEKPYMVHAIKDLNYFKDYAKIHYKEFMND